MPPLSSNKSITAFKKVVKGRYYTGSFLLCPDLGE
nr:MAG TPA: hypothetical protein [Caudoviricetes sp.]